MGSYIENEVNYVSVPEDTVQGAVSNYRLACLEIEGLITAGLS